MKGYGTFNQYDLAMVYIVREGDRNILFIAGDRSHTLRYAINTLNNGEIDGYLFSNDFGIVSDSERN